MSTKQSGGGDALCVKAIAAGGAFDSATPKLQVNDLVVKVGGQSGVMEMVDTLKKQTTVQLTVLREA
jgi:C-terminal processing protease CtpA/Prc